MSFPRVFLIFAALLGMLAFTGPARAQTVVTACGTDNAAGGTNFETAIAAGGDIVIRCATGGNEIRLSREYVLTMGITIDGEKKAALVGPGSGSMLRPAPFSTLVLKGLTLRNPPADPTNPKTYTGVVYAPKDRSAVDLLDVAVTDTRVPFVVERLRARNSSFARNGHAGSAILGVVMASTLDLRGVTFDANLARPFQSLPPDGVPNVVVRGSVVDCIFRANRAPAMWRFGTFLSDGNRFEGNGEARAILNDRVAYDLPDTLRIDDDTGPMLAGALELLFTRATINRTIFKGNKGVIGGALLVILQSDVRVQSSQFDDNEAGLGGAIAVLTFPPRDGEPTASTLDLSEVKLRRNRASHDGGALFGSGTIGGNALLFADNRAGANGGAIAWTGPTLTLPASLPANLKDQLLAAPGATGGSLDLRQLFVVDNESNGPTVDGQAAGLQFGNLLAARNKSSGGGAVVRGASVTLIAATIAGNQSAGVASLPGGSGVQLANTILAENQGGNCVGAVIDRGTNLQSPGGACGAIATGNPALDSRFAPGSGPARDGGNATLCATNPLVQARDAYGDPRGPGACSIGAVEASPERDLMNWLPRSVVDDGVPGWLVVLILIFFLLCLILGILFGWRRRRRRRAARRATPTPGVAQAT